MKINIENYLHQIDMAFKDKTQKDVYMMYVMVFSGLMAFSYLLFWDSSESSFNQILNDTIAIESKIDNDQLYLQANPESKITHLINEIKTTEAKLANVQNQNAYIKNKIETISSLIYDERTWGEYLHSISENAKRFNITIIDLTNKYAQQNASFGHILDITIDAYSNFHNIVKFINSLEQSELVVDIHTIDIKAKDKLETNLKISVWGITY